MNCSTSLPGNGATLEPLSESLCGGADQPLDVRADVVAVDHERAVDRAAVVGDAVLGDDHARGRGAVAGGVVARAAAEVGAAWSVQAGLAVVEVLVVAGAPPSTTVAKPVLTGVEVVAVAERDVDARRRRSRQTTSVPDGEAAAAARASACAPKSRSPHAGHALGLDVDVVGLAGRGADGDACRRT